MIKKLQESLAKEKRIKLAIIFGSLTRRNSIRDIDLCIHSTPTLSFKELLNLNAQLELELGIPIDLVELTALSPQLKMNILKNGVLVKGTKTLLHKLQRQVQTEQIPASS
jgi:predicted nucleotidyltransferase